MHLSKLNICGALLCSLLSKCMWLQHQQRVHTHRRRTAAALIIQRVYRGHAVRRRVRSWLVPALQLRMQSWWTRRHQAATCIQAVFRGYSLRARRQRILQQLAGASSGDAASIDDDGFEEVTDSFFSFLKPLAPASAGVHRVQAARSERTPAALAPAPAQVAPPTGLAIAPSTTVPPLASAAPLLPHALAPRLVPVSAAMPAPGHMYPHMPVTHPYVQHLPMMGGSMYPATAPTGWVQAGAAGVMTALPPYSRISAAPSLQPVTMPATQAVLSDSSMVDISSDGTGASSNAGTAAPDGWHFKDPRTMAALLKRKKVPCRTCTSGIHWRPLLADQCYCCVDCKQRMTHGRKQQPAQSDQHAHETNKGLKLGSDHVQSQAATSSIPLRPPSSAGRAGHGRPPVPLRNSWSEPAECRVNASSMGAAVGVVPSSTVLPSIVRRSMSSVETQSIQSATGGSVPSLQQQQQQQQQRDWEVRPITASSSGSVAPASVHRSSSRSLVPTAPGPAVTAAHPSSIGCSASPLKLPAIGGGSAGAVTVPGPRPPASRGIQPPAYGQAPHMSSSHQSAPPLQAAGMPARAARPGMASPLGQPNAPASPPSIFGLIRALERAPATAF